MHNKLYAQKIMVFWTKASRGEPLSTARNQCPKSFALSAELLNQLIDTDGYSLVRMREETFEPDESIDTGDYFSSSVSAKFLNKDTDHNTVSIRYKFSDLGGAPRRSHRPPINYTLTPDKLLRIEFNSRESWPGDGKWMYQLTVFNLLLTNQPSITMFMTEPVKTISDLEDLW